MNSPSPFTKLFFVSLFTAGLFAQGPDFSATIYANGGGDQDYPMTFGFSPDATDGYDDGIDTYAPPAPPPPAFDVALMWEGERYYTQILNGSNDDLVEHSYSIALAYDTNSLINLSWDNSEFSNVMSSCVLQDAFGGAFVNIDLITGDGTANPAFATWDGSVLSLFNSAVSTLALIVTPMEGPGDDPMSVTITSPESGAVLTGDVTVEFAVENLLIPDEGHIHLWVDGAEGDPFMHYSVDPITVSGLSDGSHEVSLQLVDAGHNAFDPDVSASVSFTVESAEPPAFPALFFSEAAEGSSNNKYLEIYNGSGEDLNLDGFSLSSCSNGCDEEGVFDYPDNVTFEAGTMLAAGDVYVVCHGSASDGIQAHCDQTFTYLSNGDDAFALTVSGSLEILDIIGEMGDDPGAGWAVAGVDEATKDHTLVRKDEVTSGNTGDWASSAGTNADDSEWIVGDRPTADYTPSTLGWHIDEPVGENWGCTDPDALNYDETADGCEGGGTDCCEYPITPTDMSIYDIQGQADASPHVDLLVSTSGVVTGVTSSGFWMQDGEGAWSGIWVYGGADEVSIGDHVTAVGTVVEYYDLTEIDLDEVTVNSSGNAPPTPVGLSTGGFVEDFESVVATATGVCDNNDLGYGEWSIDDGSGPGRVDDKMYPDSTEFAAVIGNSYAVTGPLDFSYGDFKLQPRDADDVVDVTPPPGDPPSFTVSMTATGDDQSLTMNFGFSPDATDGYDDGTDAYAPPAPPPPAFDAALGWGGDRYYTQILNGSGSDLVEHVYDVLLQFGFDESITLDWDNTGWSELGSFMLEDAFGLGLVNVDMTADNSVTIDNTALNTLKLKVTPSSPLPPEPGPEFSVTLNAAGLTGSYDLTAGFSADATDGFDAFIDDYAPPQPPPPAFDAALGWGGERFYIQILGSTDSDFGEAHVFDVLLQHDVDGMITLSWDNYAWYELGSFSLVDAFGGDMIYVDMNDENSITLYEDDPPVQFVIVPGAVEPPEQPTTIYEIQGQADESPLAGQEVTTMGVVTAVAYNGFYLQDGSGAWNGIWVYTGDTPTTMVGDLSLITATVIEYNGLTELVDITDSELLDTGVPLPDPAVLSTGDVNDEAYEGVLVTTSGVCDNADLGYGEWSIDDGSGSVRLDDQMFAYEATAGNEYQVTGPLYFSYGNYKIQPRDEADVVDITPEPPPAPSNLTATAGDESVDLAWDAISDGGTRDGADFTIQVNVTGDGQTLALTTGFSPDASDGYDSGVDTYAPPAPPPPAFDAALGWGGDRYYTQILAGDGDYSEHAVEVQLQYGADGCITADWDNTGWSELGSFQLKDAFGGIFLDLDMTVENSVESCVSALNLVYIHMTPTEPAPPPEGTPDFTFTFNVAGGTQGGSYDLGIGFSPDATDGYDEDIDAFAPPPPPPPAFDAALMWNGDRYFTQILNGSLDDIGVEHVYDVALTFDTDNYIGITWDNSGLSNLGSFVLQDAFDGALGINVDMTEESSLELTNPAFTSLKLKVSPSGGGPVEDDAFNVYRDGSLAVEGVLGTSYTDAPLTAGVEYCYTVTQILGDGSESGHSNEACATPETAEIPGCTDDTACNYDENATVDDGSCYFETTVDCYEDADGDGYYNDSQSYSECDADCGDLGDNWSDDMGSGAEVEGCTDPGAANYDPNATEDDGSCTFDVTVSVDLSAGWNWFSLNVEGDDLGIAAVLESIGESGTLIKDQTSYASYYAGFGWFAEGGLEEINVENMYMINMTEGATLTYTGGPVVFSERPIDLSAGWNWISYLPQSGNEVGAALESIGESGSLIKNQTSYASYYSGFGWFAEGGLENMMPLDGYMINMNEDATLTYPDPPGELARSIMPELLNSPWEVDYRAYEHNMTITGILVIDDEESVDGDDIIAAFSGEECRGVAAPVYHPVADRYTVGIMIYGHEKGEKLQFGVYDAGTGEIKELENKLTFDANMSIGNGLNPVVFKTVLLPEEFAVSQNFPNPFNPVTNIRFDLPEDADVSVAVFNANGQLISELASGFYPSGYHFVQWNGTDSQGIPVSSGVYIYSVKAGDFHTFKKMLLVK